MFNQSLEFQNQPLSGALANTFLRRVFTIMGLGLAITGLVAYLFSNLVAENPEQYRWVIFGSFRWVLMLAPLALVLVLSAGVQRLSYGMATLLFNIFAVLMGLSLSTIFFVYPTASIATTFFVTAGMFLTMAVIGLITKTDLTKYGSMFMMALIGLILASVVNIFLGNSTLDWIISGIGVVLFAGLTAYDTQKLLYIGGSVDADSKLGRNLAVTGALSLYLDFINLFLFLLRFLGNRD